MAKRWRKVRSFASPGDKSHDVGTFRKTDIILLRPHFIPVEPIFVDLAPSPPLPRLDEAISLYLPLPPPPVRAPRALYFSVNVAAETQTAGSRTKERKRIKRVLPDD